MQLDATQYVTDDGLPSGALSYSWNGGTFAGAAHVAALNRGMHQFQLRAFDGALIGNLAVITVIVTDPTPPVVTPQVVGTLGNDDWYTSNVSVTWAVDDPESVSETSTGCGPQSVTVDTPGVAFTCKAYNDEAAETSVTVSIKRDATPPFVTPPANVHASATSPSGAVVIYGNATASDPMSGLAQSASCLPVSNTPFPMGATTVTCTAPDAAGNVGSATFTVTVEDTSPPDIQAVVDGTPGSNGWYTSPVQVSWTVSDPQSPFTATGCDPVTLSADTPGVSLQCSATSAGGTSTATQLVMIDRTSPVFMAPPPVFASTTDSQGTSVTYPTPLYAEPTSGIASLECLPASGAVFPVGTTGVTCTAIDRAGNSAVTGFPLTVRLLDSTPPVIVPGVMGTLGSNNWYRSNVTVSFAVSDGESAFTSAGCGAVTVSSDTAGQTFECSATSEGGTSTQSVTIKRDATAPSLATSGNLTAQASSNAGAVVAYAAPTAADPMSGLSGAPSCAPASGSTFPIGETRVNCNAADHAGNTATRSFTVTVEAPGGGNNDAPGRMHGQGHVIVDNHRVRFDFGVVESARRGERGRVDLRISRGRNGRWDDDRFDAKSVTDVTFSNAPSYAPGRNPKSGIDTVVFMGMGKWDRKDHHTYVVTASDRGEPGPGVDSFTIEVRAPNGQVVFSGGGSIADGNVQSNRVKR